MELYHIHLLNNHDTKWMEGKTVLVPPTFKNGMYKRVNNFTTAVDFNIQNQSVEEELHMLAARLMQKIYSKETVTIKELNIIKFFIEKSYDVSYYANMFKREQALEQCRLNKYPKLPSRLHSVYLTDEEGIKYWDYTLGKTVDTSIFKVEATGNIFKTNQDLIPNELLSYEDTYNAAFKYWHPKFTETRKETTEYLVQGEIKILEKVK